MLWDLNKTEHHHFVLKVSISTTSPTQKLFQPHQDYSKGQNKQMKIFCMCVLKIKGLLERSEESKSHHFFQYSLIFLN